MFKFEDPSLLLGMKALSTKIAEWREEKGFFTPDSISNIETTELSTADYTLYRLMLMVEDISIVAEAVRKGEIEALSTIYTKKIEEWHEDKDFFKVSSPSEKMFLPLSFAMKAKLMLVVTELAEACEAIDNNDSENFAEEIADALIRELDISGTMKIDIMAVLLQKMKANSLRPIRHGKKTAI